MQPKALAALCTLTLALTAAAGRAALVSPPVIVFAGTSPTVVGTLPNQGTALEVKINLPVTSNLIAFTTSYAVGGFQPNISLYDGNGVIVAAQDYQSSIARTDPKTGLAADGLINLSNVPAGNYTVTLTDFLLQQDPSATNLSDGFAFNIGTGDQTYTDEQGNVRSGNYALTIVSTPVPEPTALAACGALVGLTGLRRRRA